MFNGLLSLYQKESRIGRTPLEDFVTEIFAKILDRNKGFQKVFTNHLGLSDDDYQVATQKKYYPINDLPRIIDIVLKGKQTDSLCFFESKVNSVENERQLNSYQSILLNEKTFEKEYQIKGQRLLVYCTKNYDPKIEDWKVTFRQLRWYEIYELLFQFREDMYVDDFLKLLQAKGMSQRMVFSAEDFVVYKNIRDSMSVLREHLEKSKSHFSESFNKGKSPINGLKLKEVFSQNKVFYRYERVLEGQGYSDMKFGFDFELPSIFVDIWVDQTNTNFEKMERIANRKRLSVLKIDNGMVIFLHRKISDLLNSKEAELVIGNWFKEQFEIFKSYIADTEKEGVRWIV
ncbi:PD-(D/E)XK nuclease family protein [Dyadobacter sp. 3J3]|uniref:PD-(D/E)XK nuclease family protein n=1 Tax=Dyadobacter sp. 3J3 TaxID=2606600 RepID=UPI001357C4BC|nr:PD-(D/E)XK nuclease family protein [Dyadobacter sp. 3J3]